MAVSVMAACALGLAPAARGDVPGNRVIDPGGEGPALSAWQATGTVSVPYGTENVPDGPGIYGGGGRLFAFQVPGATLAQTVDVSDLAASIDATGVRLSFGGMFGASGARADGSQLTAQPLDAAGAPIGDPEKIGPPPPGASANETSGVPCLGSVATPPGTRAVRVDVSSPGGTDARNTAFADQLYLTTGSTAFAPTGLGTMANGCYRETMPTAAPPVAPTSPPATPKKALPKLSALVTMSAKAKCRKTPARFRIKTSQRGGVKRLTVTTRGRTLRVDPRRNARFLSVAIKERRTTVKVRVDLVDGRTRAGTMTYRACS